MFVAGIAGIIAAGGLISETTNEIEQVGTVIGAGIGLSVLFFIWLAVAVVALIVGFFLKKSSIVEKGPTGKLADEQPDAPIITG